MGNILRVISEQDQVTTVLHEDGPEALVRQVLKGLHPELLSTEEVSWRCCCSRERVANALRSTGADTLRELAGAGEDTEVSCQFCGKQYLFSSEELLSLTASN